MSRKRRMFEIEMPDEAAAPAPESFPAGKDEPETRRGPMATAIAETVESSRDRARIVRICPTHLDPVLGKRVCEQVVRSAVERRDRDDVVAGAGDVEHGVGDRRLPGRRRDGRDPALELRDALGSRIYSGTNEIQRNLIAGLLGL